MSSTATMQSQNGQPQAGANNGAGANFGGQTTGARTSGGAAPVNKHGREKIDWPPEVWQAIDDAVKEEMAAVARAPQFLPIVEVPGKQMVASGGGVTTSAPDPSSPTAAFNIDESATLRINEMSVLFSLTPAQLEAAAAGDQGNGSHTHLTLVRRAANLLAQVRDAVVFNGSNAFSTALLGPPADYRQNAIPLDFGLLANGSPAQPGSIVPVLPAVQIVTVTPVTPLSLGPPIVLPVYQGQSVTAAASAIGVLNGFGHYGPFAMVVNPQIHSDMCSPLPTTLIQPIVAVRDLMDAGVFSSGALPPVTPAGGGSPVLPAGVSFMGFVVSLGGDTMDLISAKLNDEDDVIVRFEQKDLDGNYRFRLTGRMALRINDISAIVQLQFLSA